MANKNSPAKIAASNRYAARNYDRINIAIKKGYKDAIADYIAVKGYTSINNYIVSLITADLEKNGIKVE